MLCRSLIKAVRTTVVVACATTLTSVLLASSRDALGFDKEPTCDDEDIVKPVLVDDIKAKLVGRANSDKWRMELYANDRSGEWALLARSRSPKADPIELCVLDSGKKPFKNEKWYPVYFK